MTEGLASPTPTPRPRADTSLAGQVLIALPAMGDPRFARSVIYLCEHGPEGALGFAVNKPAPQLRFAELLDQLGLPKPGPGARDVRVQVGGPVAGGRGFVLHSDDWSGEQTQAIAEGVALSSTLDVLSALATGEGPAQALLALGYAGWGPGQLEAEIAEHAWTVGPASPSLIWGRAHEHKWAAALRAAGIDPTVLSTSGGRA